VQIGVTFMRAQRGARDLGGLCQSSLFDERQAKIVDGLGVVGLNVEHVSKTSDRVVPLAEILVNDTQIERIVDGFRPERDSLPNERDGFLHMARLRGQNAEEMERVGVSGVGLENLAVERFGFLEGATLMVAHGLAVQFGERRHALHFSTMHGAGREFKGSW
jgi:hypothetical protein